jgi:DNA-binding MarR family transcriptional regulator
MISNILLMSSSTLHGFGLGDEEARSMGADAANRLRIVRALVVLGPRLRALLDHQLASAGLTTQQATLLTLARAHRPTLAEAARSLATTRQNVKQIADALVRKGYLYVEADPDDLRATRLVTTPKNDAYWAERDPRDHAEILRVLDAIDPKEAEALYRLLSRVLDGVQRAAEGEAPPRRPPRTSAKKRC